MLRRTLAVATGGAAAVQAYRFSAAERSDAHNWQSALQHFAYFDALKVVGWVARRNHDRDCSRFAAVQSELLVDRVSKNKDTAYGRAHDFAAILASDDPLRAFRASHPITQYDDYEPWVARIAAGEGNVINAEPETQLAATSGTSGKRALLPYNPTMASVFFTRGILVVFDSLRRACPEALAHLQKTCKLSFAPSWSYAAGSGLRIGPNSSNPLDKSFQRLLLLYTTPAAGYTISDDERAAMYVGVWACGHVGMRACGHAHPLMCTACASSHVPGKHAQVRARALRGQGREAGAARGELRQSAVPAAATPRERGRAAR